MRNYLKKMFHYNHKPFCNKNGFTLLELLLSISIFALISVISAPVFLSLQSENEISIAATTLSDILHRTQLKSQGAENNSAWGVEIVSSTIKIFKGENFSGRDQSFDEDFILGTGVNASGLNEVIFSKVYGYANTTGTIILTHQDGRQKQVDFNQLGVVTAQ